MKADDFDRQFNAMRKWATFITLVWLAAILSLTTFSVWVVIKFMQHYGVV